MVLNGIMKLNRQTREQSLQLEAKFCKNVKHTSGGHESFIQQAIVYSINHLHRLRWVLSIWVLAMGVQWLVALDCERE